MSGQEAVIRELDRSELPALLALYRHMHSVDDPLPGSERVDEVWDEIQGDPRLLCFGAFIDDVLVSSCSLVLVPNLTRGCRPYAVIENVVTQEDFRRRGFGRAVLQHALEVAWATGCYKAMLLTGRKDESVYRFYESVGFDRGPKQAFLARPSARP
jgi:GNAT superfamily N-acetyltransferase